MYYHSIQVLGRATKDAELKTSKAKKPYLQIPVAVNEKDADGKENVFYYDLLLFGKSAENASKLIKKGDLIFVIGRPRFEAYISSKGGKEARTSTKVLVESWQLIK